MRNKLIKLLIRSVYKNIVVCVDDWETEAEIDYNKVADYLLANGVIVLPCEVGQKLFTVYTRGINDKFIQESTVSKIVLDDWDGLRIIKKVVDERGCCFFYDVDQEQLNKTTFFSKEEAERALRGGAE